MVVHPFVLLSFWRTRVEPDGGKVGDLRRLVGELVPIYEGLVEREVLGLLVVLRKRDEGQFHGDALDASLQLKRSAERTAAS